MSVNIKLNFNKFGFFLNIHKKFSLLELEIQQLKKDALSAAVERNSEVEALKRVIIGLEKSLRLV
jgi:hypothetical protein